MELPPVVGRLVGDSSHFDRTMRGASDSTGTLTKGMGGLKSAVGLVGGAFAAVQVGGFFKDAITGASDLAETMSKVGVVFGDSQKQVSAFANQMAKDFGLPKQEILDAAASIGLIGKASGLAQPEAAKMSTDLAKLAADASSFYNVPLPEALQAIQSGLVGEAEPMRRFGVLLNAQAVDAEAARLGLEKVNGAYTEGAKAQARASLIMSGMTDASGDLERTQGSLSNRMRELQGRFQNFTTELGAKVVPIILKVMDGFESLGKSLGPVFAQIGGAWDAIVGGFENPTAKIGASVGGLEAVFLRVGAAVSNVVAWVREQWPQIKETVSETMTTVQAIITSVVTIVLTIWNNFGSQIVAYLKASFDAAMVIVGSALEAIRGIVQVVTSLIQGDWSGVWDGIKQILAAAWDFMVGIVGYAMDLQRQLISAGMEVARSVVSAAWEGIVNAVRTAIGWLIDEVQSIPGRILAALGNLGSLLYNAGRAVISGFIDGIKSMIGAVADTLGSITSKLTSWKGPPGKDAKLLFGSGQLVMGGFIRGLESQYGNVRSSLADVTGSMQAPTLMGASSHAGGGAMAGGGGGGTIVVQLVMNEKLLAEVAVPAIRDEWARVAPRYSQPYPGAS